MGKTEPSTELDRLAAAYEATMASESIGPINKKIYDLLFHKGPMTQGELDEKLDNKKSSARLTELSYFGVVERTGKRHCSVTNRLSTVWRVTGELPKERTKERVYYPTAQELNGFVRDLTIMAAQVRTSNARLSLEFRNVMDWLRAGAPCKHEDHVVVRASKHARRVKSNA